MLQVGGNFISFRAVLEKFLLEQMQQLMQEKISFQKLSTFALPLIPLVEKKHLPLATITDYLSPNVAVIGEPGYEYFLQGCIEGKIAYDTAYAYIKLCCNDPKSTRHAVPIFLSLTQQNEAIEKAVSFLEHLPVTVAKKPDVNPLITALVLDDQLFCC